MTETVEGALDKACRLLLDAERKVIDLTRQRDALLEACKEARTMGEALDLICQEFPVGLRNALPGLAEVRRRIASAIALCEEDSCSTS